MSRFLDTLENQVLVCDGAMGTQLIEAGLEPGQCTEEWNLTYRDKVLQLQMSYARAGAQILLTNTFGANRWTMARHKLDNDREKLIAEAVNIAREAGGPDTFVAGDIGPTGELPQPYGIKAEEEFIRVLAEQAKALADAGVDFILVETQMSQEEMSYAVRAAKQATGLPVLTSASYSPNFDNTEYRTLMGTGIEDMVNAALENGADGIGANCGSVDITDMIQIVKKIREVTKAPVLIEPNAGKPVMQGDKTVYTQAPEDMAKHVRELIDAGANIIGGCCGTTPEHIAAIAAVVNS